MTALPRRHKYGAVPTIVDGIRFASKAEAKRYTELRLLERAGEIRGLQLQPKFDLGFNGRVICRYVGDFAYFQGNERIVEDVKGVETPVFRIKQKLFAACYPGQKLVVVR